jgi:hypothetical protein
MASSFGIAKGLVPSDGYELRFVITFRLGLDNRLGDLNPGAARHECLDSPSYYVSAIVHLQLAQQRITWMLE